jgi:hypothetical protein
VLGLSGGTCHAVEKNNNNGIYRLYHYNSGDGHDRASEEREWPCESRPQAGRMHRPRKPQMSHLHRAKVTSRRVARSLGVPGGDVTLWRAGVTVPKSTVCERLSELLDVDIAWLCASEGVGRVCHGSSHRTRARKWFGLSRLIGASVESRAGPLPLTGIAVEMACLRTSCAPGPDSNRTANWSKPAS